MDEKETATDWVALRAEADKLGISLADLQQLKRQRRLIKEAKELKANPDAKPKP